MNFNSKLKKSQEARPQLALRPELLLLPQIPQPMHGLAPRVIMGSVWWNLTRRKAFQSTGDRCLACGVHKLEARGHKWMEGHEVYQIDYIKGRMKYVETVPLCHFCHNFIHAGRLQMLLDSRQITQQRFTAIIQHGERILAQAGLTKQPPYEGKIAEWSKWRLVVNGKSHKPKYKSWDEWYQHFGKELE